MRFPNLKRKFKAYDEQLAKEGLTHTAHHEEIPPVTLEKIYDLLYHVYEILQHRDDKDLVNSHIEKIDHSWHNKLHYLAQYGIQVIVQTENRHNISL